MAMQGTAQMAGRVDATSMESASFERFAGICAILAGVFGFVYSLAFVIISRNPSTADLGVLLYSLAQTLGGLLTTAALVAVYNRVRETNPGFALWGMLLGVVGAMGSTIHGGYTLALVINPPSGNPATEAGLPNIVDPRGLLTFGVTGLGLFIFAWLMSHNARFPRGLVYLGYALAALLVILYLGRLIIFDANNLAVLVPAALAGFIANPAWFVWLGLVLRRSN
jgi:hypothetical protein